MRLASPSKPELGNKTFAVAQSAKVMDLSDMAEHMSNHDSKYNKGDVMAVLTQLSGCLREQLLLGNKVVLGDMGAFSVVLIGKGADNAESFSTDMITKVKVRWEPSEKLSNLVQNASFHFVGTREAQSEARKAERAKLNALATVQPEADGSEGGSDDEGNIGA